MCVVNGLLAADYLDALQSRRLFQTYTRFTPAVKRSTSELVIFPSAIAANGVINGRFGDLEINSRPYDLPRTAYSRRVSV